MAAKLILRFPRRTMDSFIAIASHRRQIASPLSMVIQSHCADRNFMAHPLRLRLTSSSIRSASSATNAPTGSSSSSHECQTISCRLPSDFLSTLQQLHPNLSISRNPYDLESHGHGESYHPIAAPDAVIRPTNVKEVQDILRLCCRLRVVTDDEGGLPTVEIVSVIPYGAGAHSFCWLSSFR